MLKIPMNLNFETTLNRPADIELDELDFKIIALLRENGRYSNREISRQLGVLHVTVGERIKRLKNAGAIEIVSYHDYAKAGCELLFYVYVQVEGRDSEQVGDDLGALEGALSVYTITGEFDLFAMYSVRDQLEIENIVSGQISKIDGVKRVSISLALDVMKFDSLVTPSNG